MISRMRAGLLGLAMTATLLGAAPAGAQHTGACDWPMYGHDLGHSFRQGSCSEIGLATAATLAPKWVYKTPVPVSASPTVAGGVVYVGDWNGTFYALPADPPPGPVTPNWTFQITDPTKVFGQIESSAAVATIDGRTLVVFGGGSSLYMLQDNGSSATLLDSECLDPRTDAARCTVPNQNVGVESSPAIVDAGAETWVVVGHGVHNQANRGRTGVVALRINKTTWTLDPVWKFDPERRLTYTTDSSKAGDPDFLVTSTPLTEGSGTGSGCGGVWSSPAVSTLPVPSGSPPAGTVYFGTANCTTDLADIPVAERVNAGEAMWAVNLADGEFRWRFSPRGYNRVDDDFGASPNLLPGGLVGEGGKDGVYYARNAATGAEAWTTRVAQSGRITVDFAIGGMIGTPAVGEVCSPPAVGACEPAVFTNSALPTPFAEPLDDSNQPFDETLFGDPTDDEGPRRIGSIAALSAVDGRVLWRALLPFPSYGAPTFANGVLVVPVTFAASVHVYSADTGALIGVLPVDGAPASSPTITSDSIYVGAGTTQEPIPIEPLSGIFAYRLAASAAT